MEDYKSFINSFDPRHNPDFLVVLTSDPNTSLKRRGGPGRLVTLDYLKEYNNLLNSFYTTLTIPKTLINTSNMSVDEVTNQILTLITSLVKAR